MLSETIIQQATQLGEILLAKGWQVTTAESCTGGGISYALTEISGSSSWFERAFVTYSNEAKAELVGVDPAIIASHGAVSEPVVVAMARGAREAANADLAVAVSGVAGPTGGTPDKPVGTVWFGIANQHGQCFADRVCFSGSRQQVRLQTISHALTLLQQAALEG
uniref:nicotinamide-nucleotide amidase n=1 Tax=Thaumasiovibrio occultus TaxID=1891184 RepID=UPI000B350D44|nr:nicotinamide-nucleotide amidase [Thaumasiovibrio occultus]